MYIYREGCRIYRFRGFLGFALFRLKQLQPKLGLLAGPTLLGVLVGQSLGALTTGDWDPSTTIALLVGVWLCVNLVIFIVIWLEFRALKKRDMLRVITEE